MKKPSVFSREHYLEELSARTAEPPIGKNATYYDIVGEYAAREFMSFPIEHHVTNGPALELRKMIFRHLAFNDLFMETMFVEPARTDGDPPDDAVTDKKFDVSKPIISFYDFAQEKMLIVLQDQPTHLNPRALTAPVKKRLHSEYGLNAFPQKPFNTLDDLMLQVPADKNILAHGDDYEPKNNHQRERSSWLHHYVDTMFAVKVTSNFTDYGVPLFDNPNIVCIKPCHTGERETHSMLLCDTRDGHVVDVRSTYTQGMICGMREYTIRERGMTPQETVAAQNVLFLLNNVVITQPEKTLRVDNTILNDADLPRHFADIPPSSFKFQ